MELRKEIFREYDIRGIYGEELDETTAYLIGKAYGTKLRELNKTETVVAYDNRLSSYVTTVTDEPTITLELPIDTYFNGTTIKKDYCICFEKISDVPKFALTLTVPTLFKGDYLFCMVPAGTKAEAIKNTALMDITEKCPATIMKKHDNAIIYCDNDSGRYLL